MPMTVRAVFDPATSRITVAITGAPSTTSYVTVRRVVGLESVVVRGALGLSPVDAAAQITDSEFAAGVENVYRVSAYNLAGEVVETSLPTPITPDQPRMWLKSVGRPFLSRPVTLIEPGEVERRSRSAAFDIVGSRDAIAVNDQHSTRSRTIVLLAVTEDEVDALDLLTSLGDIVLVQMPPGAPFRSFYGNVGDTKIARRAVRGTRHSIEIPLTEVAAPDATVTPTSATWRTVTTTYASWSALASAHKSWQSLAQLVGAPTDVWVS